MNRILIYLALLSSIGIHAQTINEICPSNVDVYESEYEGFSDWVEFYNGTGGDLDLEGYFLTDDLSDLEKWSIPSIDMDDGDFVVLSASDFPSNPETIPFSFGRKGGRLYILNSSGVFLDSVVYSSLEPNDSYGRFGETWFYFDVPTPEQDNESEVAYKGYAQSPSINRISGNYPNGTNVTIRSENEGETIYYSLNGTNPVSAFVYDSAIILENTTSIRAVATADSLIPSPAVYRTYFVNIKHKLPVVNLNLDSLELLDELIGIYVLGPDAEEEYPYWGANFWKDIEIHAFYEYFDTEMIMQESLDCGVKIHGGTVSSTRPMKSLRLVAHDRYEKESFNYPYFDNKEIHNFKRLLLRNSGSDFNQTHLKDGVLHKFLLDHGLNVDAQGYQPVIVYINGLYWGIHNMREKIDKYYTASNYQLDPETVNLLEEEELIVISGDSAEFTALRDFIVANDMNVQENYQWVNERLDLNSMVDYFIMELYVNNRDWPYNNLKLWNSSEHPQWRYFYSDLDAGVKYYGTEQIDFHSLQYILGPYGDGNVHVVIFKKLLTNTEFQRYFINRYADLMNTIFESDYILNYIYKAKEKLDPEMRRHFYKWYGVMAEWNEYFDAFDTFFTDRVEIVQNELAIVFEKEASIDVFVGMYPSQGGIIQLNSLELDSFPFLGKYYPANLIDLTVIPNSGATFLHWENLRTGELYEAKSIQIDPTSGDSLIAIFKSNDNAFDLQLYPNPVLNTAKFEFSIPESGEVEINLHGLNGVFLAQLEFDYLAKGSYSRRLDFSNLETANYLISIKTADGQQAIKFMKLELY